MELRKRGAGCDLSNLHRDHLVVYLGVTLFSLFDSPYTQGYKLNARVNLDGITSDPEGSRNPVYCKEKHEN